jgi:hypothetical protein
LLHVASSVVCCTSSTVTSHTGQPEKHAPPPAAVLVRSRCRQPSSAAAADAHLPLAKSLTNIRGKYGATDYLAGTAAGGEDHHRASTPAAAAVGHRRSLRLLCVDTGGWIRIAYANDDPIDCADNGWDFS